MKISMRFIKLMHLVITAGMCLAPVYAQTTTGNVRGVVLDANGAAVPGAKVTVTNKQTNQAATAQSADDGSYQFSDLLPGDYTINVEAANFRSLLLNDVRVELNQTTDVPSQLQVGLQGETVEVSAAGAELVDTTTTTLSRPLMKDRWWNLRKPMLAVRLAAALTTWRCSPQT
ncbi:MAG: carboxypeptidase-like regulatory domain-containing protein [Pyrinomonadaceae bacterium]